MILLDAYALVALLRDEPAADRVESLLRDERCAIPSINLAEVLDQLLRVDRVEARVLAEVVSPMLSGSVDVLSVDLEAAWLTAEIRARHHRKKDSVLSLADCVLLASAISSEGIATADPALIEAARLEGIDVISLV